MVQGVSDHLYPLYCLTMILWEPYWISDTYILLQHPELTAKPFLHATEIGCLSKIITLLFSAMDTEIILDNMQPWSPGWSLHVLEREDATERNCKEEDDDLKVTNR